MCSVPPVHQDLYNDMRAQFPELPDALIQSYVQLYPRNRSQCIEHLTRASQEQLYSQFDSEEGLVNREGLRPAVSSRLFEPLEPPFSPDQDLPPPYPGMLATVPAPASPQSPPMIQHQRSRVDPSPRTPPQLPSPRLDQPPARTDYRPQAASNLSPLAMYGAGWPRTPPLDPALSRLPHSPPDLDGMIQALLTHQRQRLELLQRTYAQQMEVLQQLRREVECKEAALLSKRLVDVNPAEMEQLKALRRRNRAMDVECHCLVSEVDLYERGEVPLGATDEHFYQRLNPGQAMPQLAPSPQSRPILSPPRVLQSNASSSPRPCSLLSEDEENHEDNRWKCSKCTFLNHPALEACEVCEMPNVCPDA